MFEIPFIKSGSAGNSRGSRFCRPLVLAALLPVVFLFPVSTRAAGQGAGSLSGFPYPGEVTDSHIISRSQARSSALTRLMGHLPAAYLNRYSRPDASGKGDRKSGTSSLGKPVLDVFSGKNGHLRQSANPRGDSHIPLPVKITMLVYSKAPEDRWANINGEKLHEGERMSEGAKVEKITPRGVLLSFDGHRFYRKAGTH
ncbi:MAG: general secretion pathway protein GspB [Syntrophobacteraceae bacterium]